MFSFMPKKIFDYNIPWKKLLIGAFFISFFLVLFYQVCTNIIALGPTGPTGPQGIPGPTGPVPDFAIGQVNN